MERKWYGIKCPKDEHSGMSEIIWWITNSEHNSWMSFFAYGTTKGNAPYHAVPIEEAIRAYKAIGYKCVELEVTEKGG